MAKHKFLQDRGVKEFFVVCRIDDYSLIPLPCDHGGFRPSAGTYGQKGGYLWPTLKLANDAARHMAAQFHGNQYGVFRLTAIAETVNVRPAIKVTIV